MSCCLYIAASHCCNCVRGTGITFKFLKLLKILLNKYILNYRNSQKSCGHFTHLMVFNDLQTTIMIFNGAIIENTCYHQTLPFSLKGNNECKSYLHVFILPFSVCSNCRKPRVNKRHSDLMKTASSIIHLFNQIFRYIKHFIQISL